MKTPTELMLMSDKERHAYLQEEVEKLIEHAPNNQVLKLRRLQARMDGIRHRIKNPQVRLQLIFNEMMKSFQELREALNAIASKK